MRKSQLRPYQKDGVLGVYDVLFSQGKQSVVYCGATGSGKTRIGSEVGLHCLRRNRRLLWVAHREFLGNQFLSHFPQEKIGLIRPNEKPDYSKPIQVANVKTLNNRENFPTFDFLLIDECHRAITKEYEPIIEFSKQIGAKTLGLTATPLRLDGKSLNSVFDDLVETVTIEDLIQAGFLIRPRIFERHIPDLSLVRKSGGDYNKEDLEVALKSISSGGHVVDEYSRVCPGKKALVFAISVNHAAQLQKQFCEAGYKFDLLTGKTNEAQRALMFHCLKTGKIDGIVNCEVATEGLDLPFLEVVLMVRPTKSLSLYIQMAGRVMRIFPGKTEAFLLDFSGNRIFHGFPWFPHPWRDYFFKREKPKKEALNGRYKTCQKCFALIPRHKSECPYCGERFSLVYSNLKSKKEIDVPLQEFTENFKEFSEEEWERVLRLVRLIRGYHGQWINHQFEQIDDFYYRDLFKKIVFWELQNFQKLTENNLKRDQKLKEYFGCKKPKKQKS